MERHGIDCDLTWGYADLANKPRHMEDFQAEREALQALGYSYEMQLLAADQVHQVVQSECYAGAMTDMGSGHLHPLNLLLGEAAVAQQLGVQLYQQSRVERIDYGARVKVHTASGVVTANQLVLACNAYLQDLEPQLSGKILPAGSYVIATEPLGAERARQLIPQQMALCDQRVALDYYRPSADHRLLFGGACHYSGRDPADIGAYMRKKMLRVFPQLADVRVEYQWAGMIGIGANRLPQIGQLAAQANVFYAQAYAGHGVNATHLAAKILGEAISGQASQGFELFSQVPHLAFPGGKYLRTPLLALGMAWVQLKELF